MIIRTISNTNNLRILTSSLIIAFIFGLSACKSNRNSIEGHYDGSLEAVIENDSLILHWRWGVARTLIGKAKITHLEGNFYTLTSDDLVKEPFKDASIDYVERCNPDTLFITVKTPNLKHFEFNVTLDNFADEYEFDCDNSSDSVRIAIPPGLNGFHIILTPIHYVTRLPGENHNGLLRLNDLWHVIDVYDKDVIVTYPNITFETKNMWYFDNEIIRIDDMGILLYGEKLKKDVNPIKKRI